MKSVLLIGFAIMLAVATSTTALGQQLEIRRLAGGTLQVRSERGSSLIIKPDNETKVPQDLVTEKAFVLGSKFERTIFLADAKSGKESLQQVPEAPLPPNALSIESVLIGEKQAGIQLKANRLNVLFASVDLMSDQGWITTHQNEDINLLVFTVKNAAKLDTARINLWLGSVNTQHIALNPTNELSPASMEKFYKSINKKRVLPTEVLPRLKIPNRNLNFGDRQVVLLKD